MNLKLNDVKYYASLVGIICLLAIIINHLFKSNLMFISDRFDIFLLRDIYDVMQGFYPLFVALVQMFMPFYAVYYLRYLIKNKEFTKIKKWEHSIIPN